MGATFFYNLLLQMVKNCGRIKYKYKFEKMFRKRQVQMTKQFSSAACELQTCTDRSLAFHHGTDYSTYTYLGVNREKDGTYVFRTYAPNADAVSLVGDFADWEKGIPMLPVTDAGVFECRVKASGNNVEGARYKFKLTQGKESQFKTDPFAVYCEIAPRNASVVRTTFNHTFTDSAFLSRRAARYRAADAQMALPLNIYEMHLGSFLRHGDASYASYTEIAEKLVPYIRQMGYTHVEFLPVAEHSGNDALGFLTTGFFAPTSRHGTPDEFAALVDRLHGAGIGVILDFAPDRFAVCEHGLSRYDTGFVFERENAAEAGKCAYFDLARNEVRNFLISGAFYWIRRFHVDGYRVITEREDPDTIGFMQELLTAISQSFPDVLMITETPAKKLFGKAPKLAIKSYRAWTKDVFHYISLDPMARMNHPAELSLKNESSASRKRFILPIAYEDVSGGKRSLIERMQGSYEQKFAQMRTLFMLQMTYPGKKLNFMGNEYGQFREWSHENELEWFMLGYDMHRRLQRFVSDLHHVYLTCAALYENDFTPDGFERILTGSDTVCYRRIGKKSEALVLLSFAGVDLPDVLLPVSGRYSRYKVLADTANEAYTGKPSKRSTAFEAQCRGGKYYLAIPVTSLSGMLLVPDEASKQPSDS